MKLLSLSLHYRGQDSVPPGICLRHHSDRRSTKLPKPPDRCLQSLLISSSRPFEARKVNQPAGTPRRDEDRGRGGQHFCPPACDVVDLLVQNPSPLGLLPRVSVSWLLQ
jgi:hypothetical protein